jgi:hypothetical protein
MGPDVFLDLIPVAFVISNFFAGGTDGQKIRSGLNRTGRCDKIAQPLKKYCLFRAVRRVWVVLYPDFSG